MSPRLELPALVAGRPVEPRGEMHEFEYGNGNVVLPVVRCEAASAATAEAARAIHELSIDDITIFLERVGKAWRDPENRWRRLAVEWGARATGYAPAMVERDVFFLGTVLNRPELYDMLETDLGDPAALDEWTRSKAVLYRMLPQGVVTHVMVGNVPMAGLFTILRSVLTKNVSVVKLPSRDVVTTLCFAHCLVETDPEHPAARSLTVLYWSPGSELEALLLGRSDVVTVWGRAESLAAIRAKLPEGAELVEFGPKRSMALMLRGIEDWERVGLWTAFDVIAYDQEACFSVQEVFVEGSPDELARSLATWLDGYSRNLARGVLAPDVAVHVRRARLEAIAAGHRVIGEDDSEWTVVVTDGPARVDEHPLARFVYVHPVERWQDVLPLIDREVQTVAVEPFSRVDEVADRLAAAGADRIVTAGRVARMRNGFIHDGFHPLRRMVRWVTIERGTEYKYRFSTASVEDEEERYRALATGARRLRYGRVAGAQSGD